MIRNTNDVIVNTKSDPNRANLYQMARIFQAYTYMVLTDEYGSIPYTEGGKGYTDQNFFLFMMVSSKFIQTSLKN
ncbi:MAG: SusD/RagB family nutrient-binding outer membrane lipoprotein [Bacteroidota bacterium]